MEFSAEQIAQLLGGKVEGTGSVKVNNLSKIEEGKPNTLSFLANPKYNEHIYSTNASVVIVSNTFKVERALPETCTLIRVEDPYQSFAIILEQYNQLKNNKAGISKTAEIASTATVGSDCYMGDFVSIGENVKIGDRVKLHSGCSIDSEVAIGDDTTIYANSSVYSNCKIGRSCTIHAGVVIGSDGFGFAPNSENNYHKIPQIGNVVIEDHVEIGANTCVDRATLGSTVIRKGVKLDNLIQIAHNVEVGENTVIGGQVGIVGHLKIADGVKIAAQSGVESTIEIEGEIVQGSPSYSIGSYKRSYVLFRSLPKIKSKIDELEKELKELKKGKQ